MTTGQKTTPNGPFARTHLHAFLLHTHGYDWIHEPSRKTKPWTRPTPQKNNKKIKNKIVRGP
jgi:hypothetical protein